MIPILIWMITNTDTVQDVTKGGKDQEQNDLSGFSIALHVLLPVAGLALLFGKRDIFWNILQQLDRSCVSVFCPSLSRREKLLKWASGRLPTRWSSQSRTLSGGISELWRDGSLLCTLINSVVPGACSNPHRHWKKPPLHAQALAYKYFGLTIVFTENEFTSGLSMTQERRFTNYLQDLQQAMSKWPERDDNKNPKFTSHYVVRGMGLYTGEQNRKASFYLYTNNIPSKTRYDIFMYVKGPYGAEGKTTIPPHNDDVKTVNPFRDFLKNQSNSLKTIDKIHLFKTISLDFTSLVHTTTCEKKSDEIPIEIQTESDRVKITYIPASSGMYEINLISNGELIKGSPFNVHIFANHTDEKDSLTEKSERTQKKVTSINKRRRIISKVIDCIDEKICISSCGEVSTIPRRNDDVKIVITEINSPSFPSNGVKIESFHTIRKISEELEPSSDVVDQESTSNTKNNENTNQDESFGDKVDFIKNFVKNSTPVKLQNSAPKEFDENNNNSSRKRLAMQHFDEIPPPQYHNCPSTSPICSDHIVSEVTYSKLPLAEKRKIFGSRKNSSFSSVENDTVSDQTDGTAMSVLNILDVLKKSNNTQKKDYDSLTSTVSLPNYDNHSSLVGTRRKYWEEMSSRSSSTTSLFNNDNPPHLAAAAIAENRGSKKFPINQNNIFNGSGVFNKDKLGKYQEVIREDLRKSADDIYKIKEISSIASLRKYKSFDESIENCTTLSIEERKRILFKDQYEKEVTTPNKLKLNNDNVEKRYRTPPLKDESSGIGYTTVADRIKQFVQGINPRSQLKVTNLTSNTTKINTNDVQVERNKTKMHKGVGTLKSSFKKARNFFKNLEEANEPKKETPLLRRHSLNDDTGQHRIKGFVTRKGGSLSLPTTPERFSIGNLYSDVFGKKNGSFKGAPNAVGLTNSLASFFENAPPITNREESKEFIKLNLFSNKSKTKKRKSVKTVFNVNY